MNDLMYGDPDEGVKIESISIGKPLHVVTVGYGAFSSEYESIAVGFRTTSEAPRAITIGSSAKSKHKNAVVIGPGKESVSDGCVVLNDNVLCAEYLQFGGDEDENVVHVWKVPSDSEEVYRVCPACDKGIYSGISWGDEDRSLCFDCIFDCVLQYKAKERWVENTGIDSIGSLNSKIEKLQSQIDMLKNRSIEK